MDTTLIDKENKVLSRLKNNLKLLNENEPRFELSVLTKTNQWDKLDYNPTKGVLRNMIIHQVRIELEEKIKASEKELRRLVNKK